MALQSYVIYFLLQEKRYASIFNVLRSIKSGLKIYSYENVNSNIKMTEKNYYSKFCCWKTEVPIILILQRGFRFRKLLLLWCILGECI